jgi:PAS domain S-box-containing protein
VAVVCISLAGVLGAAGAAVASIVFAAAGAVACGWMAQHWQRAVQLVGDYGDQLGISRQRADALQATVDDLRRNLETLSRQADDQVNAMTVEMKSLRLLGTALSHTRHPIIITDAVGRIQQVNQALTAMTGHRRSDLEGRCFSDIIQPAANESIDQLAAALAQGGSLWCEALLMRQDGSSFTVRLEGQPVAHDSGCVNHFVLTAVDITEQKQIEQWLRDSESRYRAIVDEQTEMVCRFLRNGTLTFVNEAYCRCFEAESTALIGSNWLDPIHVDDIDQTRNILEMLGPQMPRAAVQHQARRRDGDVHWHHWTISATFDDQGQLVEYQGVGRDVTDQRQAEQEMRRLARAVDASADAVTIADADGCIEYVNPAFCRITGWEAGEVVGRSWQFPISSELSPDTDRQVWQALRASGNWSGEVINCRKPDTGRRIGSEGIDGNPDRFWAHLSISRVDDESGRAIAYVAIQRDITAQKLGEQALRQELDLRKRLLSTATTAIFTVDIKGRITSINREFTHLTGYTEDEIIGQSCRIFDGDQCQHCCRLMEQTNEGEIHKVQCEIKAKDGRRLTIIKNADCLKDAQGQVIGGIESFVDVTAMVHARLEAEAANCAKSEFLANVSHEIRTPMTAIIGFADLLRDPQLGEVERHECVETIGRNGQHLLMLLNDILDLSKIEAGRLTIERLMFSPIDLVREVVDLMRVRCKERDLSLSLECAGFIPTQIHSDPTRLRQILVNLVGNAIKFTQHGGVRLVMRCGPDDSQQRAIMRFEVLDTGIGMSEEQIERLFQPFTQADTSTTRQFGGTGLGLTISRRLAQMLGGDILVHSQLGQGSSFVVSIDAGPLDQMQMERPGLQALEQMDHEPRPDSADSTPSTEAPQQSAADSPRGRILLAEDGVDNQRLISFLLKRAGYRVECAENGRIAVDMALGGDGSAGEDFDAILMDMQMPVMDGYQATQQLRQGGYRGPIIALTAHAMAHARQPCLDAGCDEYLCKPVDQQQLISMIEQLRGQISGTAGTVKAD